MEEEHLNVIKIARYSSHPPKINHMLITRLVSIQ